MEGKIKRSVLRELYKEAEEVLNAKDELESLRTEIDVLNDKLTRSSLEYCVCASKLAIIEMELGDLKALHNGIAPSGWYAWNSLSYAHRRPVIALLEGEVKFSSPVSQTGLMAAIEFLSTWRNLKPGEEET